MRKKGPPAINYATHPLRSALRVASKGPPPINYATHPLRSALTSGDTGTALIALQPAVSVTVAHTATESSTTTHGHHPSVDSLADALSNLSTNVTQSPARRDPGLQISPTSDPDVAHKRHPSQKAKYYSVIVGKCCGVYSSWKSVHPLVDGVPGSRYTGFRTYEGALWDYYTAKEEGKVKPVRDPGDEFLFGPLSRACM